MQDFSQWTLNRIRDEGSCMSWMEERRFDWIPPTALALNNLMQPKTFLLITDRRREWLSRYILSNLNRSGKERPLLPIVSLGTVFPYLDELRDDEQMQVLEDMLTLSFSSGYTFFYIGKGNDKRAQIAKRRDDSYMWLLDEKRQNSFYINSDDNKLDIKLLQLISLLDKSINAILFSEVDINRAL